MVGVYRISFTARDKNIFGLTVQVSFGSAPVVVFVCFSLYCRFAYGHKILKSKIARPAKFLSSPGVGTPKNISFHKIPARCHLLCLKYSRREILKFQNCRRT